jgi:hypothetical protein
VKHEPPNESAAHEASESASEEATEKRTGKELPPKKHANPFAKRFQKKPGGK